MILHGEPALGGAVNGFRESSGLITHKETTPADRHDSQKLEPLIVHETVAVYANSAYKSQAVDEALARERHLGEARAWPGRHSEAQKAANHVKSILSIYSRGLRNRSVS